METRLNLLTRDGAVCMAFRPSLTAEQYARVLEFSKQSESADELREVVRSWAAAEKLTVDFQ